MMRPTPPANLAPLTPPLFKGDQVQASARQRTYAEWKSKILNKFVLEASSYPTPAERITYVGCMLGGTAWHMVRKKLDVVARNQSDPDQWPEGWRDYEDVFRVLDSAYVVVDTFEEAKREFAALKQEGKHANYSNFITEFNRLADDAGKTPSQQVDALKEKVSSELFARLETNLNRPRDDDPAAWILLFRNYAMNLEEAKLRRAGNAPTAPKPAPKPAPQNHDAMQLDGAHLAATTTDSGPRPPLTEEERARRRASGACLYCGGLGHYARSCPAKRRTPAGPASAPSGQGKA